MFSKTSFYKNLGKRKKTFWVEKWSSIENTACFFLMIYYKEVSKTLWMLILQWFLKKAKIYHNTLTNIFFLCSSDTEALIHLIKMNVGIGVMAMPSAFYNSGLVVGIVAMVFMGIITVHCMHLLVWKLCVLPIITFSQN